MFQQLLVMAQQKNDYHAAKTALQKTTTRSNASGPSRSSSGSEMGGMGVVYKARDPRLKRYVAIKMMLAAEHAGQEELERFHLEAEAVARLRHSNIVQVFEVGEHEGYPYIALEFINGPDLTATGAIVGTPQFMAPEQASGAGHQVGPSADVYSLGTILYFLVSGRAPFHGSSPLETLMMVRDESPPPPTRLVPQLSKDLETICLKCLEKDPARRFASAADLAEELGRFLRGEPILARPVGKIERTWRWCRRNPVVASLALSCVLLFVAGFAGVTWKWRDAAANLRTANKAESKARKSEAAARRDRNAAVEARLAQQRQSSRLLFLRGLELCEAGSEDEAVHWLTESLRVAPDQATDRNWRRVIRTNLSGWGQRIHALQHQIELPHDARWLAFSPNGKMLVIGTMEGLIHRFDVQSGQPIGEPIPLDIPTTGWSGVWAIAFHPDGDWFLAGAGIRDKGSEGVLGMVQRIDAHTGDTLSQSLVFSFCVFEVAFSPDGDRFAVGCSRAERSSVFVVRTENNKIQTEKQAIAGDCRRLAFSRDGNHLMIHVGNKDTSKISVMDIDSGELVVDSANADDTNAVSHSPDGTIVRTDDMANSFNFELSMGVEFPDDPKLVGSAVDRGREYVAASMGCEVRVRKMARPESQRRPPSSTLDRPKHSWHHFVYLSRQHETVIVGSDNGTAQLIDVNSRTLRSPPIIHPGRILAVALSPDGALGATGVTDVRIWDVATGELRSGPLPHSNTVSVMAFSPDGKSWSSERPATGSTTRRPDYGT